MHTHTNREKLVASASTLSTPLICTQLRTQHVQPKSSHVHLQLVVRREPRRRHQHCRTHNFNQNTYGTSSRWCSVFNTSRDWRRCCDCGVPFKYVSSGTPPVISGIVLSTQLFFTGTLHSQSATPVYFSIRLHSSHCISSSSHNYS